MRQKITLLQEWCESQKVLANKLIRVFDMLHLGHRRERTGNDPIQFPAYYLKDSHAKAWHDPYQYEWVALLEASAKGIAQEALAIFEQNLMHIHPENNDLAGYGTWNTFFFYKNGERYLNHLNQCPLTANVLAKIPGVDIAGRTYFSAMTPDIHVKPHCGPHNFKLRTHLGLVTTPDAKIRVANEVRAWPQAQCIVFDDSFEHEVWNKSGKVRIVLIVDVWNPCLSAEEKLALEYIMPEFYHRSDIE